MVLCLTLTTGSKFGAIRVDVNGKYGFACGTKHLMTLVKVADKQKHHSNEVNIIMSQH